MNEKKETFYKLEDVLYTVKFKKSILFDKDGKHELGFVINKQNTNFHNVNTFWVSPSNVSKII